MHKLLNGEEFDLCCHSNLVRAVRPYQLTELDVHDVLNVFQVTGLTPDGRYFVKPSPGRTGDYLEFFAEIDVLCAISVCPHGDLSVPVWDRTRPTQTHVCQSPRRRDLGARRPNPGRDWTSAAVVGLIAGGHGVCERADGDWPPVS
mgnify:CR=1 FL=1